MLERMTAGRIPSVAHTAMRDESGSLFFEHCITERGFDGAYSILYHRREPHTQALSATEAAAPVPTVEAIPPLRKRHFFTAKLVSSGDSVTASMPLFTSASVDVALVTPTESDASYLLEGDADALYFVHEGSGLLRSVLGDVRFEVGDYVFVPRGILHRFVLDGAESRRWLRLSFPRGLRLLAKHRNTVGQLRMEAPIGHRDFRRPTFVGPVDEDIRRLLVRRHGTTHAFELRASPLDVVGWDGTVYPWALPIRAFRPRVGTSHLPPDVHGTFESDGVLVSSFVPRPLDFGDDAIPCPYPHSSVDCDEILFYASGDFLSRRGIERGSLTLHPAGIPHGPYPGVYEASMGKRFTDEVAVMLDVFSPVRATSEANAIEDPAYHDSYTEPR